MAAENILLAVMNVAPTPAGPTLPYPASRIRIMPAGERPQERLERLGAAALSDTELLAMLVRSGTRGQDVLTLCSRLIAEAGSLAGLLAWHEADFRSLKGIGRVKALQLVAAMEVARRAVSMPPHESPILNRADLIAAYVDSVATGLDVEKFWVLCLNRRNRLRKRVEVSSGTATAALAHPREVFRSAIREAASAVVCVHNHPSGDPSPSAADIQLTRQLRDAASAVDIPLLDHVIIGRRGADPLGRGYYSFREAGLL
jgi:DNA repair protein RadC